MIHIAVLNQQKQLIFSSVPDGINIEQIQHIETIQCPTKNLKRRHVRIQQEDYEIVLISYDQKITNRIFNHYIDALKLLSPLVLKTNKEVTEKETKKTRRLKHNIITHATKIQQELFKLIPQETVAKGARNQMAEIETILAKNTKNAAYSYLKILKSTNFMRSEFAAYDMLNQDRKRYIIDSQNHAIYKVLHLSLSSFWLDFIEKNVHINIDACQKMLHFDYNSVSVSLSHIFDNAVKYVAPDSNIHISFKDSETKFSMLISMVSLKVLPEEVTKIFNEEYSGLWANKVDLNGDGLGMNIVQKLLNINGIDINLRTNINASKNKTVEGIPYEANELELIFPNH